MMNGVKLIIITTMMIGKIQQFYHKLVFMQAVYACTFCDFKQQNQVFDSDWKENQEIENQRRSLLFFH